MLRSTRAKSIAEKGMSERERAVGLHPGGESELQFMRTRTVPKGTAPTAKAINDARKANPNDAWMWIQRGLARKAIPYHGTSRVGWTLSRFTEPPLRWHRGNLAAHHYCAHAYENMGR